MKVARDWDTYVMVHVYGDDGIIRSIEAGVLCIEHATQMTEVAAKAIKEADVWVVPYFAPFLTATEEQINAVLSPASAAKFLVVKEAAVEQMRLLKRYDIRKVGLSSDIIGSPATLADQNIELVVRTEVWSPYEVLLQATSINAELMALSGALNPYTDGPLGVTPVPTRTFSSSMATHSKT